MTSENESDKASTGLTDEEIRLHTEYTKAIVNAVADALNTFLEAHPSPIQNADFVASAISGALAHIEFDATRACQMSITYYTSILRNRADMYEKAVREGRLLDQEPPPEVQIKLVMPDSPIDF